MKSIDVSQSWTKEDHYLSALTDPWYKALFEIQDLISTSTTQFFYNQGLKCSHLPLTTGSISSPMGLGSDSSPVQIDLFGVPTYLADSMQFMLEYGCRFAERGCYYIMPSFRGELADERHLCQFFHSEAEIHGSIEEVIRLVEGYVRFMSARLLETHGSMLQEIAGDVCHIENLMAHDGAFPSITFDDAICILDNDPRFVERREPSIQVLTPQGEQELIRRFGGFVWVTEFDHMAVPFYQAFATDRRKSKSADLLMGIGEVVGAGERHTTAKEIYQALEIHGVDPEPYHWYSTLKKEFPMQTSGFGLGTERFICWLLKHHDIRDCQIVPRFNGVLTIP